MDSQTALIVIVLISAVVFLPRLTRRGGKGGGPRRGRSDRHWSGADSGSDYGGRGGEGPSHGGSDAGDGGGGGGD